MPIIIVSAFENDVIRIYLLRLLSGIISVCLELVPFIYITVRILNICSRHIPFKLQLKDNFIFAYLWTLLFFKMCSQIVQVPIVRDNSYCMGLSYVEKSSKIVTVVMHFFIVFIVYALTTVPLPKLKKAETYYEQNKNKNKNDSKNISQQSVINDTKSLFDSVGPNDSSLVPDLPALISSSRRSDQTLSISDKSFKYDAGSGDVTTSHTTIPNINEPASGTFSNFSKSSQTQMLTKKDVPLISRWYYNLSRYPITIITVTIVLSFSCNLTGFFETITTEFEISRSYTKDSSNISYSTCGTHFDSHLSGLFIMHPLYIIDIFLTTLFSIDLIIIIKEASFQSSSLSCVKSSTLNSDGQKEKSKKSKKSCGKSDYKDFEEDDASEQDVDIGIESFNAIDDYYNDLGSTTNFDSSKTKTTFINNELEKDANQIEESKKKITNMLYGNEKKTTHYVENFGINQDEIFDTEEFSDNERKIGNININSKSSAQIISEKALLAKKKEVYKHGVFIEEEPSDDLIYENDYLAGHGIKLLRTRYDYIGINAKAKKFASDFITSTSKVAILPILLTINILLDYITVLCDTFSPSSLSNGSIYDDTHSLFIYINDFLFAVFVNIGFFINKQIQNDCDEIRRSTGCCLKVEDLIAEREAAKKVMEAI